MASPITGRFVPVRAVHGAMERERMVGTLLFLLDFQG